MGATATVKGGLFPAVGVDSLTQVQGTGYGRRRISQILDGRGYRDLRRKMYTLDGVVAGTTATEPVKQIEPNVELGGKRVVETVNLVNRATTAADVTEINLDMLSSLTSRTSLAAVSNKDGNPLGTR
jgi:hypothetical protein